MIATIVIGLVVAGIVALSIYFTITNKDKCGCGCPKCAPKKKSKT
jgi:hypothetical protein